MPLPTRQIQVLRYLGDRKSATVGNISRDLLMSRDAVKSALRSLASRGLATADYGTLPASWSVTDIGAAVLAAGTGGDS